MSVRSFLITGSDEERFKFYLHVAAVCNLIDQRKSTVRYTCFDEDADIPIKVAEGLNLTLEEIKHDNGEETYAMIHQGTYPGWQQQVDEHVKP